ncbi:Aminodeoxychorismate lyase [Actinokineospora spheciospongiae]|uniref:Aminodeoxychorismate lyase n=1 Tax=Actinokineospora spheciospongiae TaxID=909613 RepID=W7ILZ5_9PSEU|nr:aminotransferase class IV [Actinokineospora spheciospongiae]EWC61398.1 Aminodeoxychorismate lyase [Actinokineospora spheciospongiae]
MSTELTTPETVPLTKLGYGHYTSMLVAAGRVRGLARHLERLDRDCWVVFGRGLPEDTVRTAVRAALEGVDEPSAVRVTVVAPDLDPRAPEAPVEPRVIVSASPVPAGADGPLRVRTAGYQRDLPQVKHVGTFGLFYQRRLARMAGFDDVLFVNRDGQISEGSTWNVGFVTAGGTVVWPSAPVLPGVSMGLVQSGLARAGRSSEVRPVRAEELSDFAAAFATNSITPVRLIGTVDEVTYDPDPDLAAELLRRHDLTAAERV